MLDKTIKTMLTQDDKTEVQERTIKTLDLISRSNGFEWNMLPKEVIMGMVGMYIEGVKYAKEIITKGGEK